MTKKTVQKRTDGACQDCIHFDNSRHIKDSRTAHAGLCKRFSETTFLHDSCSQWLPNVLPDWDTVTGEAIVLQEFNKKPQVQQLNLF
jgi:hypothetical protein